MPSLLPGAEEAVLSDAGVSKVKWHTVLPMKPYGVWNSQEKDISCNFLSFYDSASVSFIVIPDITLALSRFPWQPPSTDILMARMRFTIGGRAEGF